MLNVVSLLSEAQPLEQRGRGVILGVGDSGNSVLAQGDKYEIEQATECFRGVAATLVAGGKCDAQLHLTRVFLPTVQTAIADQALGRPLDDRHLKPCPRNAWFFVALVFDETCGIVRSERLP